MWMRTGLEEPVVQCGGDKSGEESWWHLVSHEGLEVMVKAPTTKLLPVPKGVASSLVIPPPKASSSVPALDKRIILEKLATGVELSERLAIGVGPSMNRNEKRRQARADRGMAMASFSVFGQASSSSAPTPKRRREPGPIPLTIFTTNQRLWEGSVRPAVT